MEDNSKVGCFSWIVILAVIGIIGISIDKCSDSSTDDSDLTRKEKKEHKIALDAYNQIVDYCLSNSTSQNHGSMTGRVHGDSRFSYGVNSISVTYTAMQYQETERGNLSKFTIQESCKLKHDEKTFYPISIQGRWQPEDTGGGDIIIALTKDNYLYFYIFGTEWNYWAEYSLNSPEFILEVFNKALQQKAKLYNTDYSPILSTNSQYN